jgi:fluoride ion exporter CrcB/FEX
MFFSIAAVAIGGALGSLLRWVLGVQMNGLVPNLPFGTLIANLSAAYIIGVSIGRFQASSATPRMRSKVSMEKTSWGEWKFRILRGLLFSACSMAVSC